MFKNYLKTALRNLWKNKSTSIINIAGLGIAIFASILIFLYVSYEFSYDNYHKKGERIYRVILEDNNLGVSENEVGITFVALGPALKEEVPEVVEQVRIISSGKDLLTMENNSSYYTSNLTYTTSEIFQVFDFTLITGNISNVLDRPGTAVINESWKNKLFGDEDPVGRTFKINNDDTYEITGVVEDVPENSHIVYDVICSMHPQMADTNYARYLHTWNSISMPTYVMLNDASAVSKVNEEMNRIMNEHVEWGTFALKLQPLNEVHLYSSAVLFDRHNVNKTDIDYLYSLIAVALFIIIIAAFNFMNLSTARSSGRAMEVGLRKVVGAQRSQMIVQFLSESVLISFISLFAALALVELFAPMIDVPIEGSFILHILGDNYLPGLLAGSIFFLGLLAGLYPALVLSGFQPIKVLHGTFTSSRVGIWLRRVLVVTQFTISIVMIIGTTVVLSQLQYIQTRNMGFQPDQIINLGLSNSDLRSNAETFMNELAGIPDIINVGASSGMPGTGFGRTTFIPEGYTQEDVWITSVFTVDDNYFNTLGMEIADGRAFSKDFPSDTTYSVIINQSAAAKLGWDKPVGKKFNKNDTELTVVGVVKDFHFENMQHEIEPVVIRYNPKAAGVISIKVNAENVELTLSSLEQIWKDIYPLYPFEYRFFDEAFERLFDNDRQFSSLITNFTWLAILIACLGLFGLAAYTGDQKTKEIGVRKILGANVSNIMYMLSRDFAILVLLASVLAVPIAYYAMNKWLEDFVYRTDMNPLIFVGSAFAALIIAILTISFHTFRAANLNPVETLRNE